MIEDNDVVDGGTAYRLRDAGFPQPDTVEVGQFWYSCGEELWEIKAWMKTGIHPLKWFACYPAYAPTVAEAQQWIDELRKNEKE